MNNRMACSGQEDFFYIMFKITLKVL